MKSAKIISLPGVDFSQKTERAIKIMRRYRCGDARCSTRLADVSGHFRKFKNIPRFVVCAECGKPAELIKRNF